MINYQEVMAKREEEKKEGKPETKLEDPPAGWSQAQKCSSELPCWVNLFNGPILQDSKPILVENFKDDFDKAIGNPDKWPYTARHFQYWLHRLSSDLGLSTIYDKLKITEAQRAFQPILDDRNFVCSFVLADPSDTGFIRPPSGARLKGRKHPIVTARDNLFGGLGPESEFFRRKLYQYLYVDPSTTLYTANPNLRDQLLAESLYLRFRDYGTYYGFTQYSGMYLCHTWGEDTEESIPVRSFLRRHFGSMYFEMANLLLAFRAALLNFSQRSAQIAQEATRPDDLDDPRIADCLEDLRGDFLRFNNKYWFCEITGQQQGIEMFNLWNRNLGNKELFEEVEKEIAALHDFSQATVNRRIGVLTYLSLSSLGVSLLALIFAALGASTKGDELSSPSLSIHLAIGAFVVGVFTATYSLWNGKPLVRCINNLVSIAERFRKRMENLFH